VFASVMRHRDDRRWPETTVWVARQRNLGFAELTRQQALQHATTLLDGYREGLASPLPMLMAASCAFGKALHDGKDAHVCARAARAAYEKNDADRVPPGDRYDPDVALCWRGRQPLDDPRFAAWAERLWQPIFARSDA
jgi:exonuclease V gamma subunit